MNKKSQFRKGRLPVDRNSPRQGISLMIVGLTAIMVLAFSLSAVSTPGRTNVVFAAPLCGDGSAPDYGFSYDLQQSHWTVGWQNYATERVVNKVDALFDRLNDDSIAQTMILILPQEQVGNRVNCAVHFLRYMKLGLPTGERKDNGLVFLIVVEPTAINVHYGVGLGLPALTAPDLTNLNRAAEAAYQPAHSMDQALLALAKGFDTTARSKYTPLTSTTPTPEADQQTQPTTTGQLCFGILILLVLVFGIPFLAHRGIFFYPSDFGSGGWGGRSGGWRGGFGGGRR